jgi:hypothetical protein
MRAHSPPPTQPPPTQRTAYIHSGPVVRLTAPRWDPRFLMAGIAASTVITSIKIKDSLQAVLLPLPLPPSPSGWQWTCRRERHGLWGADCGGHGCAGQKRGQTEARDPGGKERGREGGPLRLQLSRPAATSSPASGVARAEVLSSGACVQGVERDKWREKMEKKVAKEGRCARPHPLGWT